MKTADKIRLLRIQKGMTQDELGKKVGLQRAAINKYEKGTVVNIKRSTLQKLADALGVSPASLLDDEDSLILNSDGSAYFSSELIESEQMDRLLYYANMMDRTRLDLLVMIAKGFVDEEKESE